MLESVQDKPIISPLENSLLLMGKMLSKGGRTLTSVAKKRMPLNKKQMY